MTKLRNKKKKKRSVLLSMPVVVGMWLMFVTLALPKLQGYVNNRWDTLIDKAVTKFKSEEVNLLVAQKVQLAVQSALDTAKSDGATLLVKDKVKAAVQTAIQTATESLLNERTYCKLYSRFYNTLKKDANGDLTIVNSYSVGHAKVPLEHPDKVGCKNEHDEELRLASVRFKKHRNTSIGESKHESKSV